MELLKLLLERFQRPMLLLLLILATGFLLLGIVGGAIQFGRVVVPSRELAFRVVSILLGVAIPTFVLSLEVRGAEPATGLPQELRRPLSQRRHHLTATQERLLRFVADRTQHPEAFVSEAEASGEF